MSNPAVFMRGGRYVSKAKTSQTGSEVRTAAHSEEGSKRKEYREGKHSAQQTSVKSIGSKNHPVSVSAMSRSGRTLSIRADFSQHSQTGQYDVALREDDEKGEEIRSGQPCVVKYSSMPDPSICFKETDYMIQQEKNVQYEYDKKFELRNTYLAEALLKSTEIASAARKKGSKIVTALSAFHQSNEATKMTTITAFGKADFERPDIAVVKDKIVVEILQKSEERVVNREQVSSVVAEEIYQNMLLNQLSKHNWFITSVTKIQATSRRINHVISISCYRFLMVCQVILMYGFEIDNLLFYNIIEKTIHNSDHSNVDVYRILKNAIDSIGVKLEDFLQYLNAREIQPCADMLAHVRKERLAFSESDKESQKKNE